MWISALVGMATKFAEAQLGVKFREKTGEDEYSGGVMYYIEKGMGGRWKWLASLYAFFAGMAAFGGFAGASVRMAVRFGIARGVFSNEAGLGAASMVHAQARNKPTRQGMWGIWEVFIDTIVVGTITALVVLLTGALGTGETGAVLAAEGFSRGLPGPGGYIINISIIIFAYTTMLTWSFYGEESWKYLFGKKIVIPYRLIFVILLFVGAVGALEPIWLLADTLNGLMAAPNLIALVVLVGVIVKEKDDYLFELKEDKAA